MFRRAKEKSNLLLDNPNLEKPYAGKTRGRVSGGAGRYRTTLAGDFFLFGDYFSRERNYISEWEVSQMGRGWSAAGVPNTDFTDHTQICGGSKRMITD